MRAKICGIRDQRDVDLTVSAGADALGFLLHLSYKTNDEVEPEFAARAIQGLPPFVASVLVTHDLDLGRVLETQKAIGASTVQMHGATPPSDLERLRERLPSSGNRSRATTSAWPTATVPMSSSVMSGRSGSGGRTCSTGIGTTR